MTLLFRSFKGDRVPLREAMEKLDYGREVMQAIASPHVVGSDPS